MSRIVALGLSVALAVTAVGAFSLLRPRADRAPSPTEQQPAGSPIQKTDHRHRDQFSQYAELIAQALRETPAAEDPIAGEVVGGVVPHHIPTTISLLADFYRKLRGRREVRTFVVLGPDHVDRARDEIVASQAGFATAFGTLEPDLALIGKLQRRGLVAIDEEPFDREHSIGAQLPFIAKVFPTAKIVPLLFRSSSANARAAEVGRALAALSDDGVVLVASVDFSHYRSAAQSRLADELSARVLENLAPAALGLVEADSPQSLAALLAFARQKGAVPHKIERFNTADFAANRDFTTGYLTGFFATAPPAAAEKSPDTQKDQDVSLVFVGDIMLSRNIGKIMQERSDWTHHFRQVAPLLREADLTFGNLEGPISARGENMGSRYSFRADPRSGEGLTYAGFDVLSIANNHVWDYGSEAFADTLRILKESGIGPVGGGANYPEAHAPLIKEVRETRIAFLAYTNLIPRSRTSRDARPAVAFLDIDTVTADVRNAKREADIVAVSFHWGEEYKTKRNAEQERIAKAAIDEGASLVIGHHPHVVQELERYREGYIAYSLGNFVFDQNFSPDTGTGMVLKVLLRNKKIARAEPLTVRFTKTFQPFLEPANSPPEKR